MYEHYMFNYFNVVSLEIWHNHVTEKSWQNEQSVSQINNITTEHLVPGQQFETTALESHLELPFRHNSNSKKLQKKC